MSNEIPNKPKNIGLPDFEELQKMEQEQQPQQQELPLPKYTLIPKFWHDPSAIECIDMEYYKNDALQEFGIKFIDSEGRLGTIRYEDVGIRFINNPTKEDIEDFRRLKIESKKLIEEFEHLSKKPKEYDKSIA